MFSNGFLAWHVLASHYGRTILSRSLRMYRDASHPHQVLDMKELISASGKWEVGVKELERREGSPLRGMIKLAALTGNCPDSLRDLICQHADDVGGYQSMREKLIGRVRNKSAMTERPAISHVDEHEHCNHEDWEIGDTGALGKSSGACHICQSKDQWADRCPDRGKDKGKTRSERGKDKGKGFGGGGYRGTCRNCWELGHKAHDCPKLSPNQTNHVENNQKNAEEEIQAFTGGV